MAAESRLKQTPASMPIRARSCSMAACSSRPLSQKKSRSSTARLPSLLACRAMMKPPQVRWGCARILLPLCQSRPFTDGTHGVSTQLRDQHVFSRGERTDLNTVRMRCIHAPISRPASYTLGGAAGVPISCGLVSRIAPCLGLEVSRAVSPLSSGIVLAAAKSSKALASYGTSSRDPLTGGTPGAHLHTWSCCQDQTAGHRIDTQQGRAAADVYRGAHDASG